MPERLELVKAERVQNTRNWAEYTTRRDEEAADRGVPKRTGKKRLHQLPQPSPF